MQKLPNILEIIMIDLVPATESPRIRGRTELMEAKLDMVAQLHRDKSVMQEAGY